jgi:hypothetical protein
MSDMLFDAVLRDATSVSRAMATFESPQQAKGSLVMCVNNLGTLTNLEMSTGKKKIILILIGYDSLPQLPHILPVVCPTAPIWILC